MTHKTGVETENGGERGWDKRQVGFKNCLDCCVNTLAFEVAPTSHLVSPFGCCNCELIEVSFCNTLLFILDVWRCNFPDCLNKCSLNTFLQSMMFGPVLELHTVT